MWVGTVIIMKLVIHHTRLVIKYLSAVLEPWLGLNYQFAIWLEGTAPSFPVAFIISRFRCLCTASVDPHRGGFWSFWEIYCLTGECLSPVFSWCCPLRLHLPPKLHYVLDIQSCLCVFNLDCQLQPFSYTFCFFILGSFILNLDYRGNIPAVSILELHLQTAAITVYSVFPLFFRAAQAPCLTGIECCSCPSEVYIHQ